MSVRVIAAGFGRTGTLSTKAALEKLLGGPCYHMFTILESERQLGYWSDWARDPSRSPDWVNILDGFVAVADAPMCFFWEELMERYPDAKVVLTLREPERWYASFRNLMMTNIKASWMTLFSARARRFGRFGRTMGKRFGARLDKEGAIATLNAHNQRVRDTVPSDRLLEMSVKDGWGPLCEFLGCAVPDEPFPHLNEGVDVVRKKLRQLAFGRRSPQEA